jgi:hypothetical protein
MSTKSHASVDKRAKVDLDLFVLAMVKRGLNTPYALLSKSSLSVGATIPVFNRLERAGYVSRRKPSSRNRTEYRITGRKPLSEGRLLACAGLSGTQ